MGVRFPGPYPVRWQPTPFQYFPPPQLSIHKHLNDSQRTNLAMAQKEIEVNRALTIKKNFELEKICCNSHFLS
jgi:hypothetical protein